MKFCSPLQQQQQQQKLFIHYNFSLQVIHHLNFRIVFRGSKTNLFPEHLVFLISDHIREDHLRRFPISERETQDPWERSW